MSLELTETEIQLMETSAEIGALLECESKFFTPLSKVIEATGKSVDELTVGELRELINQRRNDYELIYSAGGTA